jgi:hypothetical protein
MPPRTAEPDVVRLVIGNRGRVPMWMRLAVRFDHGSIVPWVRTLDGGIHAVAGPDSLVLRSSVAMHGENLTTAADFVVEQRVRRGAGHDVPVPARGPRAGRAGLAPGEGARLVPRGRVGPAGRGDLEGAGPEAALHAFQNDELGGGGPRGQVDGALRARRAACAVARAPRQDPRRGGGRSWRAASGSPTTWP